MGSALHTDVKVSNMPVVRIVARPIKA